MRPVDNAERAKAMASYYGQGATLDQVGLAFGLSRERIRQILNDVGVELRRSTPRLLSVTGEQRNEVTNLRRQRMSIEEIAQAAELPVATTAQILEAEMPSLDFKRYAPERSGNHDPLFAREHLIAALQACAAAIGPAYGCAKYDRWRKASGEAWPSGVLITTRLGWNAARSEAGLPVKDTPKGFGERVFSDEQVASTIAGWALELGHPPSLAEATQLRKPGQPSVYTIRVRLGSWMATRQIAYAALDAARLPARSQA